MSVPPELLNLMKKFEDNLEEHLHPSFNEDSTKNQFIDPLFELLGWDVNNKKGATEAWRDVLRQHSISVGAAREAPDYIFKIGRTEVFVVEAKKPSLDLNADPQLALQARSYGWNRKLPLAILTNFREFAVYDCRQRPKKNDKPAAARLFYFLFKDYPAQWDDILSNFTREAVEVGKLDKLIEKKRPKKGTLEVDEAFLREIEEWRKILASNIALRNPHLNEREINYTVQMTIDRIVFLRICEDRGMESPNQLLGITNAPRIYARLFKIFDNADERYNSGLFHFREEKNRATEPDRLTPKLEIDDDKLKSIIRSLYDNFYDFSLLPVEILGQIYEKFLGNVIYLTESRQAKIKPKPAVKKAKGVFYTPSFIVDYIVDNTVGKLLEGKTPAQVSRIKIVDPACGSGSFLLGAYQKLLNWHLDYYSNHNPEKHQREIYPVIGGGYRLTTAEKKRILLNNFFGVDIDSQAVEVTKLSLLLKVLEDETEESLRRAKIIFKERALPDLGNNIKCGNSLIGSDFYRNHQGNFFEEEERYRINVFDWETGFPEVFKGQSPGFDAVIGNPPYVRQEGLVREKSYYQSHYHTFCPTADLYVNFIEKGMSLLNRDGLFGMIVSNKWLRAAYGRPLREYLTGRASIHQLIDLAGLPVFSGATVRTIILIGSPHIVKRGSSLLYLAPVSLEEFKLIRNGQSLGKFVTQKSINLPLVSLKPESWTLSSVKALKLIERIRQKAVPLKNYIKGEPSFGIKTGLNEAFIIDNETRKRLISQSPKCKEIIKPILTGRDVRRYSIKFDEKYLIWTYMGVPINRYPAVLEHLEKYQAKLKKRWDKGNFWWELRACDYYDKFEQPKIIYPDIAKACRFTLDRKGYFSNNTTYFLPGSDLYLLGILNSRLGQFIFTQLCAGLEGGGTTYLRFFGQYLEYFPVRSINLSKRSDQSLHDQITISVQSILDLHTQLEQKWIEYEKTPIKRQVEATDRQIDEMVYELYGLTKEEIALVEGKT